MPAQEGPEKPAVRQLLPILFWVGVGLAPLAALLILLARGEGVLRIAAVLAVLGTVLIGLSVTLGREIAPGRGGAEDQLLDEIDALREELRSDIATAARTTHRASGERLQRLYDEVQSLRGQVESLRSGPAWSDAPPATGRGSTHQGAASPPYAGTASVGFPDAGAPPAAGTAPASAGGRASVPGTVPGSRGVVRHTETVHVTTRHTIVDEDGPDYGHERSGGPHGRPYRPDVAEPADAGPPDTGRWGTGPRAVEAPPAEYAHRSANRWASLRSDERGSELRVGERRATAHADGSGAELHVEDRWATVRREEPRTGGRRRAEPDDDEWPAGRRSATGGGPDRADRGRADREPDWRDREPDLPSWRDREPDVDAGPARRGEQPSRRGRRRRDDDDELSSGYGVPRPPDDRWR
ncbi:hypothetical protein [Polymorphospora rubra]|uniref:hypothetical protein n=1 Tax=Polymorphospora rubra TaxID=338584 RepID=UPI0031E0766C